MNNTKTLESYAGEPITTEESLEEIQISIDKLNDIESLVTKLYQQLVADDKANEYFSITDKANVFWNKLLLDSWGWFDEDYYTGTYSILNHIKKWIIGDGLTEDVAPWIVTGTTLDQDSIIKLDRDRNIEKKAWRKWARNVIDQIKFSIEDLQEIDKELEQSRTSKSFKVAEQIIKSILKTQTQIKEDIGSGVGHKMDEFFETLKSYRDMVAVGEEEGFLEDEKTALQQQISEWKSLMTQNSSKDMIPSDKTYVLKNDAMLTLDQFKHFWIHTSKSMEKRGVSNSVKSAPNYRYTMGEFVKIRSSGRIAKIIGMNMKTAKGGQMYTVRMLSSGLEKKFKLNDLSRHSFQ